VDRTLVIDENLDKRIATELKGRGRAAISHGEIGLKGLDDEEVLERLANLTEPWVFVTGDDKLPFEHAAVVSRLSSTIATIDSDWESICDRHGMVRNQDSFGKDAVHRWAHTLAVQDEGSVRRLTPMRNSLWTPKRRYTI
jgi:hypothetical protein